MKKAIIYLLIIILLVSLAIGCNSNQVDVRNYPTKTIVAFSLDGADNYYVPWHQAIELGFRESKWDVKFTPIYDDLAGIVLLMNDKHDGYIFASINESIFTLPVTTGDRKMLDGWEYYIFGGTPGILCVNKNSGISTMQELIKASESGKVDIGCTKGGIWNTLASLFKYSTDINIEAKTYSDSSTAVAACVKGDTVAVVTHSGLLSEHIASGELVPIAVFQDNDLESSTFGTVEAITRTIPDMAEYLPMEKIFGLMVADDTPDNIKATIEEAFLIACQSLKMVEFADSNNIKIYKFVGQEADEKCVEIQSRLSWMLYDMGKAKYSPEQFNIPKP